MGYWHPKDTVLISFLEGEELSSLVEMTKGQKYGKLAWKVNGRLWFSLFCNIFINTEKKKERKKNYEHFRAIFGQKVFSLPAHMHSSRAH